MMSSRPLLAVAAVAAVLLASAGFPLGQSATGVGIGVAAASPCPPILPCKGPPKPPKLPGLGGGGGGPKGPRLPDFGGGGGGGPKGPRLPDFGGGGGGGPKGPRLPDFGGGGGGPKGPRLPGIGGGPGFKGPHPRGPADVRRAFTPGGPHGAVHLNVPGALRAPRDLRPDFRFHAPGLGRLNPDAHLN